VPPTPRLLWVEAPDVRDLVVGIPEGGRKLEGGLALGLAPSARLAITGIGNQGWGKTLELLRTEEPVSTSTDLLLTSVSSEFLDPSQEPGRCLIELARLVQEDRSGRVAVLNASSLTTRGRGGARARSDADALSLRIKRLNLLVMEASHEAGLSVVDADQLVAERNTPEKVAGPFDYSPPICEALQSRLVSILHELGFADRTVMEARVPFVRQAGQLTVERWLKSEGDVVAIDEAICEIRLGNIQRMTRPTNAIVLASIKGRTPLFRTLLSRERVRQRIRDATLPLVAAESAYLREILRPAGAGVHSGDVVALLTRDLETPIVAPSTKRGAFRATMRSPDPNIEVLL
jgi:hypothetical protein